MSRVLLLIVCVTSAAHAVEPRPKQPADPVPRLEETSAREAQAAWMAVKEGSSPATQLDTIAKKHLLQKACDDLVDLHVVSDAGLLKGFVFRDNVRGRSWARPTMAALLSEAMKRFQAEYPGRTIAIGDVSQPGCGQVAHGVLVQEVTGDAAAKMLATARLELGEEAIVEMKRPKDFPWEADRFPLPDQRVLVTTKLVAKTGSGDGLRLRTARTRHVELGLPTSDETRAFEAQLGKAMHGTRVALKTVESEDGAGVRTPFWLTHYVAADAKLQAVIITRNKPAKRLDWADVVEVRIAEWDPKKPGSFPDEVRWVVDAVTPLPIPPGKKVAPPTPLSAVRFVRWALMYEAGHITHLSGIDADLSYVTVGDVQHFAVDLPAMDVPATWRWIEILEATGRDLGTPVDAVLVDQKIKRHLETSLPQKGPKGIAAIKRTKAWQLLTIVNGHDAHHHLRITESSAAQERAARKKLGL